MEPLNEAELILLRAINELTSQHGGRSPTFAEIAVAIGLPSSSRGTVQRRLTRLRGEYVEWGASSRSLVLTPNGQIAIGGTATPRLQQPISESVLPLLASGLMHMAHDLAEGTPPVVPFPQAWQRGINILAADCLRRGIVPPSHLQEAIAMCKRPPSEWPVRVALRARVLDQPLLDEDDQPTTLCSELSEQIAHGNPEHELCERLMLRLRDAALVQRKQQAYVAVRSLLIRMPVISRKELIDAVTSPELDVFGRELFDLYEPVPVAVIEDEQVRLCGHCGWTLERWEGRTRCAGEFCSVLTRGFTHGTRTMLASPSGALLRVRQAIRQFVVSPGRHEMHLYDTLRADGLKVELWPDFDTYDLGIEVGAETWAVDIKDWRYAHLLAGRLLPFRKDTERPWDKAFYVIPDARAKDESYLTFLKTATAGQPFEVLTMTELQRAATGRKRG
jgi:hypothetical protein